MFRKKPSSNIRLRASQAFSVQNTEKLENEDIERSEIVKKVIEIYEYKKVNNVVIVDAINTTDTIDTINTTDTTDTINTTDKYKDIDADAALIPKRFISKNYDNIF